MSDYTLSPDKPIDVAEILKDLENYRPRRRGWTWRKPVENLHMGPFVYHDCTEPLTSTRSPRLLSRQKSHPAALRMIFAECVWQRTTAQIT